MAFAQTAWVAWVLQGTFVLASFDLVEEPFDQASLAYRPSFESALIEQRPCSEDEWEVHRRTTDADVQPVAEDFEQPEIFQPLNRDVRLWNPF